jgi:cytochrome P450
VNIPAGAVIWMVYAAANRDAAVFENAEVFDPARTDAFKAVSFGNGRHFCPGQPLARLEAKTTFEEALRRMKNIRLKDESVAIPYHDWFVVHGPTELEIVFDPA